MFDNHKIIDSHCHIYPEKIASKAVKGTDRFYGVKSHGAGTVQDLVSRGTTAGIDHFIVQSVATTPRQVESINRFIAGEVASSDGRLTGLGTLYPDSPDLEKDFELIKELGLKGIKLHPDIQGFKIDDFRCLKIYELCERDGLPILMHTGDSRYDNSNPNRLAPILKIYSGLTVIGAHFGGWSIWRQAVKELGPLPNLYVDCSSSLPYLSETEAKRIIECYGTQRVLFGTDYPMWEPSTEVKAVMKLGLSESELDDVFYNNAAKLFGI